MFEDNSHVFKQRETLTQQNESNKIIFQSNRNKPHGYQSKSIFYANYLAPDPTQPQENKWMEFEKRTKHKKSLIGEENDCGCFHLKILWVLLAIAMIAAVGFLIYHLVNQSSNINSGDEPTSVAATPLQINLKTNATKLTETLSNPVSPNLKAKQGANQQAEMKPIDVNEEARINADTKVVPLGEILPINVDSAASIDLKVKGEDQPQQTQGDGNAFEAITISSHLTQFRHHYQLFPI